MISYQKAQTESFRATAYLVTVLEDSAKESGVSQWEHHVLVVAPRIELVFSKCETGRDDAPFEARFSKLAEYTLSKFAEWVFDQNEGRRIGEPKVSEIEPPFLELSRNPAYAALFVKLANKTESAKLKAAIEGGLG